MFDLRSARYFVAVAEELHFGRAARRLQMSQPPLSQAIRQLERDVGATLLHRTNRTVEVTPAGRAFLVECRALLRHADAVAGVPRLYASGARSRLTVGTVASALHWPLPDALAELRRDHPDLAVFVREIDSHEAVPGLLDGTLDLALARLPASRPDVVTTVLIRDPFVALLPRDHRDAGAAGPVDLLDLADDEWIWLPREISPDYHDDMAGACRRAGFSPRVAHWARSIESQIALADCGLGVTIVPETSARSAARGVPHRPVRNAAATVTLSAATTTDPNEAVEQLLASVAAVTRAGAAGPGPRAGAPAR